MSGDSLSSALAKINANEKGLDTYINILKRKIENTVSSIQEDEGNIAYIQKNMGEKKATLESDKILLEGLEALIALSKNY